MLPLTSAVAPAVPISSTNSLYTKSPTGPSDASPAPPPPPPPTPPPPPPPLPSPSTLLET